MRIELEKKFNQRLNNKKLYRAASTPLTLIAAGIFAMDNDLIDQEDIWEIRQEKIPNFKSHLDDYLQFAPIAAAYGLHAFGVKGHHRFGDRTMLLLKSELLMMAIVTPLKKFTHVKRPDGSAFTAFPSGHTAQAFVAATFFHKEYGHLSPWYSIAAYTAASSVGILRVLNNRHWLSDVLAGAGIGILATNLVYLTHRYKWSDKPPKRKLIALPSYHNNSFGFVLNLKF
ncbi:phosphatase PAP2 family protein [Fulvivirgaceae bacterium BMA10]|uniref:Phosphatase PAP2 family protein n=1 Tax=Splendidivirga corallicola TaxID=3051826 RepID=A0ABT8KNT0_9BACT|nr:phosphatase PAP2 family protein [Fulvivirgaceae bacterium BMA10]